MFLVWLVLLIGIEIGIRTDAIMQMISVTTTKNLRFRLYLVAWIISFLFFWSGLNAFVAWYFAMLALVLLPTLKYLIKYLRKSQIPARSISFLDLVLLNMKGGQSLRKSAKAVIDTEKSWFVGFQLSLARGLELGSFPETESAWFNNWAQEIVQIDKSRNKVVEQLEILRRYSRQELNFKKKMLKASAGPRAQAYVMSLLFFILNVLAFHHLDWKVLKSLLPMAWFLYFLGLSSVIFIVRSFKWKV